MKQLVGAIFSKEERVRRRREEIEVSAEDVPVLEGRGWRGKKKTTSVISQFGFGWPRSDSGANELEKTPLSFFASSLSIS